MVVALIISGLIRIYLYICKLWHSYIYLNTLVSLWKTKMCKIHPFSYYLGCMEHRKPHYITYFAVLLFYKGAIACFYGQPTMLTRHWTRKVSKQMSNWNTQKIIGSKSIQGKSGQILGYLNRWQPLFEILMFDLHSDRGSWLRKLSFNSVRERKSCMLVWQHQKRWWTNRLWRGGNLGPSKVCATSGAT